MQVKPTSQFESVQLDNNLLLLAPKGLSVPSYSDFDPKKIDKKGYVRQGNHGEEEIKAQIVVLRPPEKDGQTCFDIVTSILPNEVSHPFKVIYERPPLLK